MTRADELVAGDLWLTPSGAWDVVATAGPVRATGMWQVTTEHADPLMSWLLAPGTPVQHIPAGEVTGEYLTVRPGALRVRALLLTGAGPTGQRGGITVAVAHPLSRGRWLMWHCPPGGVLVRAVVPDRDAAVAAVTAAARAHAVALRLPMLAEVSA